MFIQTLTCPSWHSTASLQNKTSKYNCDIVAGYSINHNDNLWSGVTTYVTVQIFRAFDNPPFWRNCVGSPVKSFKWNGLELNQEPLQYLLVYTINKWASSRENLSFGFPAKWDTNQPAQLQRQARKMKISLVASLDMERYKTRITKALIRLRGCAGWSAPVLFANTDNRFSRVEAH